MSEWESASLSELAEIRVSNVDKKIFPWEQDVHLCNYMDVYGNDYIKEGLPYMEASATYREIDRFGLAKGDVLLTKDSETPDDIGIPAVGVDEISDLVCGYHIALIRPRSDRINSIFLAKQLAAWPAAKRFARLANGSTRYGLSYSAIASTALPVPPVREQRQIAEILSTLDAAIEWTEALIAKYRQVKAGLMQDLFTRGVTPDGRLRPPRSEAPHLYKESSFGWIPNEWDLMEFGDGISGTPQNGLYKPAEYYSEAGTPIVRIDAFYDGVLSSIQDLRRLRLTPGEVQTYGLCQGDILINRVNSIDYVGKSAIIPMLREPVVYESNMMRCRLRREVLNPDYAIRWLCSDLVAKYFFSRAKSAIAQASINQQDVRHLPMVFPDHYRPPIPFEDGATPKQTLIKLYWPPSLAS